MSVLNIIICVDNKMGTMFNNRRQSRDRVLCRKIAEITNGSRLFVKSYSAELFRQSDACVICDDNYLMCAENGDFCFVEGDELLPYADRIENIIICRWNRDYPGDKHFDIDLSSGWKMDCVEEFPGSSHEKITLERYVK